MPVIGERFSQALRAHRLHGNAIAVEIEAGQERRAAPNNAVGENALYAGGGPAA